MPELTISKRGHYLALVMLAAAAALSGCASDKPQTALVSDPDGRVGSAVPWNKPANWEGRGNIPTGLGETKPFAQSGGGTGGY